MMKFDILFKNGVKNPINKQNLSDYFIREFKKAERDHFYTPKIFFPPLYQNIEAHRKRIATNHKMKKEKLQVLLSKAKRNELDFYDHYLMYCLDKKGIEYEAFEKEQNQNYLKAAESNLKNLTIENIVSNSSNGFKLSELELIENALKKAEEEVSSKSPLKIRKAKENLHPQIFKNNGFEIWQSMFESFDVKESSLTDIRFMYEAMKNDGFIFDTIGEKNLRDWINETYSLTMNKAKFTNPKWDSNKKRMAVYSAAKDLKG